MCFEAFGYHCAKHVTSPLDSKLNKNIKGLELEINNMNDVVYDSLDELCDDYHIVTYDNEDEIDYKSQNIAIEEDGSVDYELVFRADTIKYLMERIKLLNEYGLNPDNVENTAGTSAHIHYNRAYLNNKGIYAMSMQKAAEFCGYPAFLISGRTKNRMNNWARTILPLEIEADLLSKAQAIDRLDSVSYNRYNIMNFNPSNTYELRIFSNKCGFDYANIKLYLEFSDIIADIAEEMGENISYEENIETPTDIVDSFFKSKPRRRKWFDKYNMDSIFLSKKELEHVQLIKKFEAVDDRIKRFESLMENHTYDANVLSFIRMIRDIQTQQGIEVDIRFNPSRMDFESLNQEVRDNIRRNFDL